MYAQCEGKFLGQQYCIQLADFLMSGTLANGLPAVDNVNKLFNGMGCLAAQVVAHFKKCPGAFYLVATDLEKCGQEYEYHIFNLGSTGSVSSVDNLTFLSNFHCIATQLHELRILKEFQGRGREPLFCL